LKGEDNVQKNLIDNCRGTQEAKGQFLTKHVFSFKR
jgi:hypothetical protein